MGVDCKRVEVSVSEIELNPKKVNFNVLGNGNWTCEDR